MKVEVEIEKENFDKIMQKKPWLGYESIESFAFDAVRLRIESLLLSN